MHLFFNATFLNLGGYMYQSINFLLYFCNANVFCRTYVVFKLLSKKAEIKVYGENKSLHICFSFVSVFFLEGGGNKKITLVYIYLSLNAYKKAELYTLSVHYKISFRIVLQISEL